MSEWIKYKISMLIESKALVIGDGYRAKNSELSSSEGLPFARAGDVNDGFHLENAECLAPENLHKAGEKIAQVGDVLFTSKGTVGRIAFVTDKTPEFVYSPQLTWWRVLDQKKINPDFLYCWMRGREFISQLNSFSGQTDMAAYVSLKDQRQMMYITLPEIEEQKEIAAAISCLDRKIDTLRKQNDTLEKIAQTLFKHWFINFEFPNVNGKPYKSSGGAMESSELGEIPAGWRVSKLSNFCDIKHGYAFKGEFITTDETDQILLTPGNVRIGGGFNSSKYKYYSDDDYEKGYILSSGDLIITMTDLSKEGDTLGYPAFVPRSSNSVFLHNQRIGKVINNQIDLFFLFFLLCRREYRSHILGSASGSTVRHTSPSRILEYEFAVPSTLLLDKFSSTAGNLSNKTFANLEQIQTLTKTRDALLPKLMSGKLRIQED